MAEKKVNKSLLAKQVFILVSKIAVVLLIVISLLLVAVSKIWPDFTQKFSTSVAGAMFPVTQVFATASRSVGDYWNATENVIYANTIAKRAKELEKENFKARLALFLIKEENDKLKEKLNFLPEPKKQFFTARMAARSPGPIINAGFIKSDDIDKIEKDNIIINEDGLVGQVESVSNGIASIILITDKRSSVPVKSKNYGKRAILVGTGTGSPRLDYIISTNKISLGEEILTSGDGGIFPPDIPVGYVKDISKGQVLIETYVDWSSLDYVFILK